METQSGQGIMPKTWLAIALQGSPALHRHASEGEMAKPPAFDLDASQNALWCKDMI
jgi:hypothetical protein